MRIRTRLILGALVPALCMAGCVMKTEDKRTDCVSFTVEVTSTPAQCEATEIDPCPFSADQVTFTLDIEALGGNGSRDTSFNKTVLISLVPSGILPTTTEDPRIRFYNNRRALAVPVAAGLAESVDITFGSAFGDVQLIIEDVGYTPSVISNECLINGQNCPICYNHPVLPEGCFAGDDNDPESGTGATGVSRDLVFDNPTVADVQYVEDTPDAIETSPLAGFRVMVDGDSPEPFNDLSDCIDGQGNILELLMVVAITTEGFYVTDLCNNGGPVHAPGTWRQFGSLYAYNFHAPENLVTGDCIMWLQGGAADFYGFTELNFPAWSDPVCLDQNCTPACDAFFPGPQTLEAATILNDYQMEMLEASVVAVQNAVLGHSQVCDTNGNGQIDWDISAEADCEGDCADDPDCWVYESYADYFQFTVNVNGAEIAVVTRGVVIFDPLDHEGQTISYIAGTLKHLSFGGPPWIMQPRNEDDFQL